MSLKFRGLFFKFLQLQQSIIPAAFQCGCDQTLGRIHFLIAPLGERGFILGPFEPHLPLAQEDLIARLQLLQGSQGQLECGWLQGLQYFLDDGGIEQIATEAQAVFARQPFAA